MSTEAPPPAPEPAPAKKSMSPLAWIAIGCGGVIVIGFVVFLLLGIFIFQRGREMVRDATGSDSVAELLQDMEDNPAKTTAETMIRLNPDLEIVTTNDAAGTITFRDNRTGEEATLNFEDAARGRFSMTTSDGAVSIEASGEAGGGVTFRGPEGEARFGAGADLSDVPDWVPAYPGATDNTGTMHVASADGVMGSFTSNTSDGAQAVIDYFKGLFDDRGYTVGAESITRSGDGVFAAINGELAEQGRSINVVIIESEGKSQITINYNQKAQ